MAFPSRFPGHCSRCGQGFSAGTMITWSRRHRGKAYHAQCPGYAQPTSEVEETTDEHPTVPETTPDVSASTPQTSADDAGVVATLAAALRGKLAPEMDEAAVRRIAHTVATEVVEDFDVSAMVAKAMERYQPTIIEVRREDGSVAKIDGAHYRAERAIKLAAAGFNLYLWGPAGSGKTTLAFQIAEAMGRTPEIDTLDPSTSRSMVMGFRFADGTKAHTQFTRMYGGTDEAPDGGVYVGDEVDNAPAYVQTVFNSALANGHAPFGWGSTRRAPHFLFIGTGNTPGRPTPQFPDRRPMSEAFKDRLYFLHMPIDPAIECRAAGLPIPQRAPRVERTCTPAEWGQWVQDIRAWAATNAPTLMVTPRATLEGIKALAIGETPEEIADGLVFRGADPEMVAKALRAVPLP